VTTVGDPGEIDYADERTAPGTSEKVTKGQIRGSSLLLVGRLIALGVNTLAQILIARYLSQSAFGAFAYALSLVAIGETIVTLGLDRGLGRFVALYDERGDVSRVLGTLAMVIGSVLSVGLAVILVVVGLQEVATGVVVSDPQAAALLTILIILAPIQAADNLFGGALAVFARARSIFVRKYIVGPALRLAVVILLITAGAGVSFLAIGYVVSGLLGVGLYAVLLWQVLRQRGLLTDVDWRGIRVPAREILAFTVPLITTDLVYVALHSVDAIILGRYWDTTTVAEYRVIQPLVTLNQIVYSSFTLLYMPAATRLFARKDRAGVAHLYWKTAIWMAILSFPIFAMTTSLAEPVTVALYEDRYAESAVYLAILSFAAYTNVALGFNGLTLRVYGLVRFSVAVNLIAAVTTVALDFLLIPAYGALGASVATAAGLIAFNVFKQAGLRLGTGISVFDRAYVGVYASILLAVVALAVVQFLIRPGLILSVVLAGLASAAVLAVNRRQLDVATTFPEILRLPFARRILGV
jgi:O-antigen/teichoic acid export membrane protein